MSLVRVVFLGTPGFARTSLEALVSDKYYKVVGVVTQPDSRSGRKMQLKPCPVKELAMELSIPVLSSENINAEEVLAEIATWRAEAAVVVAFGQILSQKFLNMYPEKVVNIHASLLPRWRGAAPIQRAIMAGDKATGVALQVMVKKLDAGAIIGLRKVSLDDSKSAVDLHDELSILGADLLHNEFKDYLRGNLVPVAQDEEKVTLAPKIEKSEGRVDFTMSAEVIHRRVLGLSMGPGSFTFLNGKLLKIHKTSFELLPSEKQPLNPEPCGTILSLGSTIRVQCGQGTLHIHEIQPESRPRMSVSDFLKGHKLQVGQVFGG